MTEDALLISWPPPTRAMTAGFLRLLAEFNRLMDFDAYNAIDVARHGRLLDRLSFAAITTE